MEARESTQMFADSCPPLMLSVDTEFPESADEAFYTMFQGLFDALKERFDDLG